MLTFIIRRVFLSRITIWALTIIFFVVIQLPPGDFVDAYVQQRSEGGGGPGSGGNIVMEESLGWALRAQYGLDKPMVVRYFKWIRSAVQGDFRRSLEFHKNPSTKSSACGS